jgi:hypothetical protein
VERLSTAAVTVTNPQGNALELSPVESSGTRLVATADRMRIGERGLLTARVHGDDLRPWVVGFEIESAAYHSDELAQVTLRALDQAGPPTATGGSHGDGRARAADRVQLPERGGRRRGRRLDR